MGNESSSESGKNVSKATPAAPDHKKRPALEGWIQKDGKGHYTGKGFRAVYLKVGNGTVAWHQQRYDPPKKTISLKGYKVHIVKSTGDTGQYFDLQHHDPALRNISFRVLEGASKMEEWTCRIRFEIDRANSAARTRSVTNIRKALQGLDDEMGHAFMDSIDSSTFNDALGKLSEIMAKMDDDSLPKLKSTQMARRLFDLWKEDGKVDWYVFQRGIETIAAGTPEELVALTFDIYDTNGDGRVSKAEFLEFLTKTWLAAFWELADLSASECNPEEVRQHAERNVVKVRKAAEKIFQSLLHLSPGSGSYLSTKEFYSWAIEDDAIVAETPVARIVAETSLVPKKCRVRALTDEGSGDAAPGV